MRKLATIFLFLLASACACAQPILRTVVPQQPVVAGESFQVQYVLEEANPGDLVTPPSFSNFRLVSGPAYYKGSVITMNGVRPLINAVYTLEAIKPGKFLVQGATVKSGQKTISSEAAEVVVISKQEAHLKKEASSDYFLGQGEDVNRKIRENLFIKVQVDKKTCFVGQPVVATFKLYSRLQSRSDIIKNPGFYGFSVFDLVNLSDKVSSVENIRGKTFDVHTIRKVQLFPLQAGTLYIDEMEVRNRVEFSRSSVNKKTEQEIIEGLMGFPEEENLSEGTEVFESEMHTDVLAITVKPLPTNGRAPDFQGAVGKFNIQGSMASNALISSGKGEFVITIRGQGNFIQLDAPRPSWPAGMEVFEPKVNDDFDQSSYPLKGERRFIYPFVVSRKGDFSVPPVRFDYFDPDSGKYQTVSTTKMDFSVSGKTQLPAPLVGSPGRPGIRLLYFILGLLLLAGIIFWMVYKKKKHVRAGTSYSPVGEVTLAERLLQMPAEVLNDGNSEFYSRLLAATWKFFEVKMGITGTQVNKNTLFQLLRSKSVNDGLLADLGGILDACEAGMFTGAELRLDKKIILEKSREIFSELEVLL